MPIELLVNYYPEIDLFTELGGCPTPPRLRLSYKSVSTSQLASYQPKTITTKSPIQKKLCNRFYQRKLPLVKQSPAVSSCVKSLKGKVTIREY